MALQSKTSRVDRLRLQILAAAPRRSVAMHDSIVTYHQLLGIEEGEPIAQEKRRLLTKEPPT